MHTPGVNSVYRRLAATTGLLLILMASAAGADPLVADAAIAAASQQLLADVAATEVDVSASSSSVFIVGQSVEGKGDHRRRSGQARRR